MTQERLDYIETLVNGVINRRICNDMGIDDDPDGLFNVMKELVSEIKKLRGQSVLVIN